MGMNDVYELKHVQRDWDMKHIENVYFYRQVADGSGGPYTTQAERLANDWNTDVLTPMLASIPLSYITNEVRVRNLFNPADAFVLPLSRVGTRSTIAAETQPSFLAAVVTLATDNGLVQKGRKMISGMMEGDMSLGQFSVAGMVIFAIRAALMLASVSTLFGGAKAFDPVVVKRIREGTPGNYTYRLPETQLEAIVGNIQSAVCSAIISAQDTRKR